MTGGRAPLSYAVAPGQAGLLRLRLTRERLRELRRAGSLTLTVSARNADATGGTPASLTLTVLRR